MHRSQRHAFTALLAIAACAFTLIPAHAVDEALIDGLEYRLIGPWRGGRVTTVTGVPDNPQLYYMGATGGGVWKTENAGVTWENISDGEIPVGTIRAVAVAESDPNVIYVGTGESPIRGVTTSQGEGVWKSTDAGRTFEFIGLPKAGQIRRIKIHPKNPDLVYVAVQGRIWAPNEERGIYRSKDGGKTWEKIDTPRGDHHDPWINPHDNNIMINGNDGGATITFDGGETWSSIMNQPTAQFYRLITDNQTPYRLYAGQQDNSTVSIAAWTWDGGIGEEDYYPVGGGESAHIAFDPADPTLVYATTINGTLTEYDHETKKERYIIPYPEMVYGKDSKDLKYRANWNPPVITSPHEHSTIYYGTQMLLRSTDRGLTWEEVSPDLTRNNPAHMGRNGGPLTPENVGVEFKLARLSIHNRGLSQSGG